MMPNTVWFGHYLLSLQGTIQCCNIHHYISFNICKKKKKTESLEERITKKAEFYCKH